MAEKISIRSVVQFSTIALSMAIFFVPHTQAADWPGNDWPMATPQNEGVSSQRLNAIAQVLAMKKTRAFLVVRNDHLIYEWYASGVSANTKQGTASLAKALVGGMS